MGVAGVFGLVLGKNFIDLFHSFKETSEGAMKRELRSESPNVLA